MRFSRTPQAIAAPTCKSSASMASDPRNMALCAANTANTVEPKAIRSSISPNMCLYFSSKQNTSNASSGLHRNGKSVGNMQRLAMGSKISHIASTFAALRPDCIIIRIASSSLVAPSQADGNQNSRMRRASPALASSAVIASAHDFVVASMIEV